MVTCLFATTKSGGSKKNDVELNSLCPPFSTAHTVSSEVPGVHPRTESYLRQRVRGARRMLSEEEEEDLHTLHPAVLPSAPQPHREPPAPLKAFCFSHHWELRRQWPLMDGGLMDIRKLIFLLHSMILVFL